MHASVKGRPVSTSVKVRSVRASVKGRPVHPSVKGRPVHASVKRSTRAPRAVDRVKPEHAMKRSRGLIIWYRLVCVREGLSSPHEDMQTKIHASHPGKHNSRRNLHTDGLRLHKPRTADQSDYGTSKTNTPHLVESLSYPKRWVVSKAAPLPREGALRDGLTVALCFPRPYPTLILELFLRSAGGVIRVMRIRYRHEGEAIISRKTFASVSVVVAILTKMCSRRRQYILV